jgi:hypothetical protein
MNLLIVIWYSVPLYRHKYILLPPIFINEPIVGSSAPNVNVWAIGLARFHATPIDILQWEVLGLSQLTVSVMGQPLINKFLAKQFNQLVVVA